MRSNPKSVCFSFRFLFAVGIAFGFFSRTAANGADELISDTSIKFHWEFEEAVTPDKPGKTKGRKDTRERFAPRPARDLLSFPASPTPIWLSSLTDVEAELLFRTMMNFSLVAVMRSGSSPGYQPVDPRPVVIATSSERGGPTNKGFRRDNQNWALRLTAEGSGHYVSFLFASDNGSGSVNWHRWTSDTLVESGNGWHHVAVSYRFGQPESIRGWIDGESVKGQWDMAGSTTAEPVTDQDEVWIGSSMGGSAASSFLGAIDSVSVRRSVFDDDEISRIYQRDESIERVSSETPPTMPEFGILESGLVHHRILEGIPLEGAWPYPDDLTDSGTSQYLGKAWTSHSFLIPRLPLRFDDWGIRSSWQPTLMFQTAADVQLPVGSHRFLVRARSLARLWVDGKLVAQTKPQKTSAPSGEEPITPIATPPVPGVRVKGYRQQEVIGSHTIDGVSETKKCRVVLELIAGGKNQRVETGEVCVAVESESGESFDVLVPQGGRYDKLSLREQDASVAIDDAEQALREYEKTLRRKLADSQTTYWKMRRKVSRQWAEENMPPQIPRSVATGIAKKKHVAGVSHLHPIDAFVEAKIAEYQSPEYQSPKYQNQADQHSELDTDGEFFKQRVFPILQEHCLRCHGRAAKGELKLDSLAAARSGGESGWPAVVPGKPDESELVFRIESDDPDTRMPPGDEVLDAKERQALKQWIQDGARWPEPTVNKNQFVRNEKTSDSEFLRRVYLDSVGVPPTEGEAIEFLSDQNPDRRTRLIDRVLDDDRVADHLVSDWLDMLAENPTLLNTSLNSTGPFRFFLHDAFVDRKPLDRVVTELVLLRGDRHTGGSAGFGVAGENDSPLAAKAHILASGLLAIDLQCARCHDAPFHSTTQEDLFSIAAMLNRKPLTVPKTSRVPDEFFEEQQRDPLIEVTLEKGAAVKASWTLARYTGVKDDELIDRLVRNPSDSRDRLAALLTSPNNRRFPAVIVNRIWTRLMGAGLVGSLHDWEHLEPTHPELLQWLSHQLVASGYDIRFIMKLVMTSDVYARRPVDLGIEAEGATRLFAAPRLRRLSAEQVVDSLFQATGREIDSEELTFVHDGRRPLSNRLTLGTPVRAWMFATLNNERDRPSLSLPKARTVVDVLQAFGWRGSRQRPIHQREKQSGVLQPGILANGLLTASLSRAAVGSPLANLAVDAPDPATLVDSLFLRFLTRYPSTAERQFFVEQLSDGFFDRIVPLEQRSQVHQPEPLPLVHWFNHLRPRANEIQQEVERRVSNGPTPDPRLEAHWRQCYEDMVWSLINHDEFVWMP